VTTSSATNAVLAVRFDQLTNEHIAAWLAAQAHDPTLDSPYYHPLFARTVHEAELDVDVAVELDEGGTAIGFLPVHRRGPLAVPVGAPAADFQGAIRATTSIATVPRLMAALRVRRLAFDHVPVTATDFAPFAETTRPSPYLDVSDGLDGYLSRASRSGKDNMAQARRRARKAERELGTLRFVADSTDPDLLDRVIALKRDQYAATGARDYFADRRHVRLMHDLLRVRTADFAGALSAVYAGDRLVAAHFGMRSAGVLHWWFPVYDPALGGFAPGWMLLRELVIAAPELAVRRIDLGRGEDEYKRRAMTGVTEVSQGLVTDGSVRSTLWQMRSSALTNLRSSAAGPVLGRGIRLLRKARPQSGRNTRTAHSRV
jgi:CelD/BcsL family acetyltransferase involved in cellulose biosynthesis